MDENDAWLAAAAESIDADVVGADRAKFERLGARYLRFRQSVMRLATRTFRSDSSHSIRTRERGDVFLEVLFPFDRLQQARHGGQMLLSKGRKLAQ